MCRNAQKASNQVDKTWQTFRLQLKIENAKFKGANAKLKDANSL